MNEESKMADLLRRHVAPMDSSPPRDLWPVIVGQRRSRRVSWNDLGLAAAIAAALLLVPEWIWLIAYHL
jgi:hypothetical protein